jgi:hypothetical protein
MRAGTLLLFLVIIVMGFGFLLSSTMYMGQDLAAAQEQIRTITGEKAIVDEQLERALGDLANFKQQVELLIQEKLLLTEQLRQTQAQYRLMQEQNEQMRAHIDRMDQADVLLTRLANLDPGSLMVALIVPLLPISLAGSILIFRKGRHNEAASSAGTDRSERMISISVTKEEMRRIQQYRRHQAG